MNPDRLQSEVLILAGGTSSRMGLPKPLLLWEGIPLWFHIARKAATFALKVRIVGFPEGVDNRFFLENEFSFINDRLRVGPLGGLLLGLEQMQTPHALVIACDMPFISSEATAELLNCSENQDVVIPRTTDGLHPLFSLYSCKCIHAVRESLDAGERKIRAFFPKVKVREIATGESALNWNKILFNINSPQDYSRALHLNGSAPSAPLVSSHFSVPFTSGQAAVHEQQNLNLGGKIAKKQPLSAI
ncbi:MAG: molybdenum cofactor guanylyltransferase [Candidatus Ozemobacteraceae bacterium]